MTILSLKDFGNELYGSFDTYWTQVRPEVPVAYPNRVFDPEDVGIEDSGAWVRLYSLATSDETGNARFGRSSDPAVFYRSGILTVEVYIRVGQSTDLAYDLADDVLAWMEKPDMATVFLTNLTGAQEVGPDGTWFQIATGATWQYFTDRANTG